MTITTDTAPAATTAPRMLWLDLTRKCQLGCTHCYNASGPDGSHGTMTRQDWISVLDQAADCGIEHVQLIGGEPTLHPDGADLVEHALARGLLVEVYSNLVHVPARWWDLYQRDGVGIATSYYSDRASEHNAVTGRPSHQRTRTNIAKAVGLGIHVRAGIITRPGQDADPARRDLAELGVTDIRVDHVRPFGRGADGDAPDASGLCGRCGDGKASIGPDGTVSPCVFSTWMGVADVHEMGLADILGGAAMADANASIRAVATRNGVCEPDKECTPGHPGSGCSPRN